MKNTFRAFSNNQFYYSDDEVYVLKEIEGVLFLMEDENFYNNKDCNLVKIGEAFQSTGLKDKNGTEVFQDDMLNICKKEYPLDYDSYKRVVFKDGMFQLLNLSMHYYDNLFSALNMPYLVVGNIYENPELFKN